MVYIIKLYRFAKGIVDTYPDNQQTLHLQIYF
jgi:hypothetical protein